jgi:hypothetical protein
MRAVISVVSSFWMVHDPLRVICCVIKNNIDNTEHSIVPQALHRVSKLS